MSMIINPYRYAGAGGDGPFLFDIYGDAFTGLSLRKLKSTTVSVIRVLRSSDSAESDFTADEVADGTLTSWVGANTGYVVVWYNQGSGNDFIGVSGSYPEIVRSGVLQTSGGLPIVNRSTSSTTSMHALGQPNTAIRQDIFAVITTHNNGDDKRYYTQAPTGQNSWGFPRYEPVFACNFVGIGSLFGSRGNIQPTFAGERLLFNSIWDGSDARSQKNGGDLSSPESVTATERDDYYLFSASNLDNSPDGAIAEMIDWHVDQTPNRAAIEADINAFYSLW